MRKKVMSQPRHNYVTTTSQRYSMQGNNTVLNTCLSTVLYTHRLSGLEFKKYFIAASYK